MTRKSAAAPGREGGFTVLELLVTLCLAGVLLAVAVPAFGALVKDSRRTEVVNELLATLLLARAEAIKQRRPVVVCGFHDANRNGALDEAERACAGRDWSDGWFAALWDDADRDNAVDAGELTLLTARPHLHTGTITVGAPAFGTGVAPSGTAIFRPFAERSGNGTITVCDRRGPEHARAVVIAGSGRVRVASRKAGGAALTCR